MASLSIASSSAAEDEDDEEPILKYARYESDSSSILENDSLSAIAHSKTTTAIGSHNGIVYVLNALGKEIRRYRAHSAAITDLSLDQQGRTIASASLDGRLVLYNLQTKETSMYDFKRPLRCTAIDPEFSSNGRGRVISGGLAGQVILNEKGWMGTKETVLSAKEGVIMALSWHKNLVAWANDYAVCVYDIYNSRMVGRVDRQANSARSDLFKCRLLWQDADTLLVGWFDRITKIHVQEGIGKVLNLEIAKAVRVDYIVCGLAFLEDNLLVMAYIADLVAMQDVNAQIPMESERPELRILNSSFGEVSEDALGLKNFSKLQPNDYTLLTQPDNLSFLIAVPKDIISARKRSDVDHLQYLVEIKKFEAALEASLLIEELPSDLTYVAISKRYLADLLAHDAFKDAARLLPRICGEDASQWEKYVDVFQERNQLAILCEFIPYERPVLSSTSYEKILQHFLARHDYSSLLRSIQSWPGEIYNVEEFITQVKDELTLIEHKSALQECLAALYIKDERPREALQLYLTLQNLEAFALIKDYHLFDAIKDDVLSFLNLDEPRVQSGASNSTNSEAISILIDHIHSIPVAKVVDQIKERPDLLFAYFRGLLQKNLEHANDFSNLQIATFAEYDRTRMMTVLKTSSRYSFDKAIQICEQRNYIPELVFILGRTGENKKALHLIIEKLDDVKQAIDFAMLQADPELWEDLIVHSLNHPRFICGLLENATSVIDPVALLKRIPKGLVVEGLKDSLLKIFSDYDLQLSLSQGGRNIHRSETIALSIKLHQAQKRGRLFKTIDIKKAMFLDDVPSDVYVCFDDGRILGKHEIGLGCPGLNHKKLSVVSKIADCTKHKTKVLALSVT